MAHATTQKQFNEIRDTRYTVIRFKGNKRVSTYMGLNIQGLQKEVLGATKTGSTCLVFEGENAPKHSSWDLADYI
jgi:hypothetical protein